MAAVHIREVPERVLEILKHRARRHDRSLQGELRHILLSVARTEPSPEPLPPLELHFSAASPETTWRREDVYDDDGR